MRRSGILMHISSLPSRYGIGKLGASAYQFADFLKKSGVSVWQILPLSPTSYGDSPYQSFSAYAGNPYFIDFEQLEEQGLLEHTDYADANWGSPNKVDYERLYQMCFPILKKAFQAFDRTNPDYVAFCEKHRAWLPDYALFMALKFAIMERHGQNGNRNWQCGMQNPCKRLARNTSKTCSSSRLFSTGSIRSGIS